MTRPHAATVVGIMNPHSVDPADALDPVKFPNSAGSRLYALVADQVSPDDYRQCFRRVNLDHLDHEQDTATGHVILLGKTVAHRLKVRVSEQYVWHEWLGKTWVCLVPHPSGLCRDYNDHRVRLLVREILLERYRAWLNS